jgi:chemotaxis protein CheX
VTEPAATATLSLSETLDLKAAAPLQAEILANRHHPLDINAERVQRLGGLCLQVLLSAKATWAEDRKPFAISSPSPAFQEAIALFGASDLQSFALQG